MGLLYANKAIRTKKSINEVNSNAPFNFFNPFLAFRTSITDRTKRISSFVNSLGYKSKSRQKAITDFNVISGVPLVSTFSLNVFSIQYFSNISRMADVVVTCFSGFASVAMNFGAI